MSDSDDEKLKDELSVQAGLPVNSVIFSQLREVLLMRYDTISEGSMNILNRCGVRDARGARIDYQF